MRRSQSAKWAVRHKAITVFSLSRVSRTTLHKEEHGHKFKKAPNSLIKQTFLGQFSPLCLKQYKKIKVWFEQLLLLYLGLKQQIICGGKFFLFGCGLFEADTKPDKRVYVLSLYLALKGVSLDF